jgi:hypothetical protein
MFALGVVVERLLQQVAVTFPSYFNNSKNLKSDLEKLDTLPPGAQLFIADAVSMYTNIDTDAALTEIANYLRQHEESFPGLPIEGLVEGLTLVMRNNYFTFGDTYWLQKTGAAMGQPPSPPYATIYFGIHEERMRTRHSETTLTHYFRYLDDYLGIWVPHPNATTDSLLWEALQADMNNYHGLQWEFGPRSPTVNYLDLTITITSENRIETDLFEKALNLYLYIPPLSAHPPGVLSGLVLGNCHRIYTLVTSPARQRIHFRRFYFRLMHRGYKPMQLKPLFCRAVELETRRQNNMSNANTRSELDNTIFYHLQYHQQDPPSRDIQQLWSENFSNPPYEKPSAEIKNRNGFPIAINRLIIAYSRPPNLNNILSSKNLANHPGPPVSSLID